MRINGGFWVVMLMACAPALGQWDVMRVQDEQKLAAARMVGARGRRGGAVPTRLTAAEARLKFIEAERIARLPADQMTGQLLGVYDSLNVRYPQIMDELAGNTALPAKLLMDRISQRGMPINPSLDVWGKELDEIAPRTSPEQIADTIVNYHSARVQYTAARRRLAYAMLKHKPEVIALVGEDLKNNTPDSNWRAFGAIHDLELSEFVSRSIDIYLAGGPNAESALFAISWVSSDAAAAKKLIDFVEKDPSSLNIHSRLISVMLQNQPADPRLLAMLDSPDAGTRYGAAVALRETHDEVMLARAPKLLEDPGQNVREVGIYIINSSPKEQFKTARPLVLKLLEWPDKGVQLAATRKLADQKDPAAGPAVLRFLRDQNLTPLQRSQARAATQALMDWSLQIDTNNWTQNALPIPQVEEWIKSHPDAVQ